VLRWAGPSGGRCCAGALGALGVLLRWRLLPVHPILQLPAVAAITGGVGALLQRRLQTGQLSRGPEELLHPALGREGGEPSVATRWWHIPGDDRSGCTCHSLCRLAAHGHRARC
jgi:hypothetical protein